MLKLPFFASRNFVYGIFVANVARISTRVLRTKFWVKSAYEDDPQVVPACIIIIIKISLRNDADNTAYQ